MELKSKGSKVSPEKMLVEFLNAATTTDELNAVLVDNPKDKIRKKTLERILKERMKKGRFESIKEIEVVAGIDKGSLSKIVEKIKELCPTAEEESLLKSLPLSLRLELKGLKRHEKTIVEKAKNNPDMVRLFLNDPGKALADMGITMSSTLRKKLPRTKAGDNLFSSRKICIPGGTELKPKINIRLVVHRGEG